MNRRRIAFGFALVVVLVVVQSLGVSAHHPEDRLDDQLVDAGNRLMFGGFEARQPGPLVIVPHQDGPLSCRIDRDDAYLLDAGPAAGVNFLTNGTHLRVIVDLPADTPFYAAAAVDTGAAVRSLIMMEEHLVSMHRFGAVKSPSEPEPEPGNRSVRWGMMGVPYALSAENASSMQHDLLGDGIRMDHDDQARGGASCIDEQHGIVAFFFPHDQQGDPLGPGRIAHAVTLFDDEVVAWLPRPVDESTSIRQWNLYLSRAGEDPQHVRSALSPQPQAGDLVPVALLGVGFVWALAGPRTGKRS